MAEVMLYKWRAYDIRTDDYVNSARMATPEAIALARGEIIDGSGFLVDEAVLGREVAGMTERGFNPHSALRRGFQTIVTS